MKKLTSLQVLMLMGLALGSTSMYGKPNRAKKSMNMQEQKDLNEAVMYELQSAENEEARVDVLTDLASLEPLVVERIVENEADLESSFNSIRNFIHKKNEEIEKLNQENSVNELELARLAVELTDAQSMFDNTLAKERAKNKRNPKAEQAIKDALMKAKQGLKTLSKKVGNAFNSAAEFVSPAKHTKKSKQ